MAFPVESSNRLSEKGGEGERRRRGRRSSKVPAADPLSIGCRIVRFLRLFAGVSGRAFRICAFILVNYCFGTRVGMKFRGETVSEWFLIGRGY